MADAVETTWLPTKCLRLDRRNPRLVEFGIGDDEPETEIIELLWDTMDVQELVQSIAASGYFEHEPLIVAKEDGSYVVIEGNRRLAAVRVLLDDNLSKRVNCRIRISDDEKWEALQQLPVLMSDRGSSWRYLGFKHVNGPAKWSSYAKAQYIAEVHDTYEVSLAEIAEQIGDRYKTVQRLYRGLMVLNQAEKARVFHRNDRYRTHFSFSHLYTGLQYNGIIEFLSLNSKGEDLYHPVPQCALEKLGELLFWLYGNKRQGIPPVVKSQNPDLRNLDTVLANRESLAALRDGQTLDNALEFGRKAEDILAEALLHAKRELMRASGQLAIGYKDSKSLLHNAEEILDLAHDIYQRMRNSRLSIHEIYRSRND